MSSEMRNEFLKNKALLALRTAADDLRKTRSIMTAVPKRRPPAGLTPAIDRAIKDLEKHLDKVGAVPITSTDRRAVAIEKETQKASRVT